MLPSAPQTKPLPLSLEEEEEGEQEGDDVLRLRHDERAGVREYKSQEERMSKEERARSSSVFKRITAYCVAESLKTKLLASFLKREHNVAPRVYDEAMYVVYHLPLLPGYLPETNVRSSAPVKLAKFYLSRISEAEENGYQGTYFEGSQHEPTAQDLFQGYISSSPPMERWKEQGPDFEVTPASSLSSSPSAPIDVDPAFRRRRIVESEPELGSSEIELLEDNDDNRTIHGYSQAWRSANIRPNAELKSFSDTEGSTTANHQTDPQRRPGHHRRGAHQLEQEPEDEVGEVVFFEYGVVVFFGLEERCERDILEDIERAGILKRPINEEDWEIEECHYIHDPYIAYPRIYNDLFTLKSRSHLLKLSISHALAQSTLLARYETNAQHVLSSPLALSIPQQLALSGQLQLPRHDALKLTGRLFKLRRDVNLVSNVLDVPELFWSEASLGELYEAVREYMEIKGRVQVLNEKLGVASDFLDAIHDHLNTTEMNRITWTVIWLIVVAVVVELGEIIARLLVHSTRQAVNLPTLSKRDALRVLKRMLG